MVRASSPKLYQTPNYVGGFSPAYDRGLWGTRPVPALDGLRCTTIFGGQKQVGGVAEVRTSVGLTSGEMGLSWEYLGECWEYLGEQTFAPKRLTSGRLRSAASANGWPGPYGLAPPPGWRLGRIGEKGVPAKIRQ